MYINKNNFYKLFLLILIFSFPIIINNNFYIDDNVRLITGSPDWSWVGRPFADYLYYILSSNKLIDDFFPISLILGILFFCFIVSNIIKEDKSWLGILPYSFFIVNPFFLQNLNYRFDSLPMLIAVSMGIYAFFYESNKKYKEWIFPICSLVLCLGFYQPCVNIFLMLIACNTLTRLKIESKMYVTFKYGIIYILSNLIYLIISKLLGLDLSRGGISDINEILGNAYQDIFVFFKMNYFLIGVPGFILLVSYFIYIWINKIKEQEKINDKILTIISPVFIFLSFWGPLILLKEIISLPRELPSVGAFIFILSIEISRHKNIFKNFIILLYIFIVLESAKLANIIKIQEDFNNQIYQSIVFNITNNPKLYNVKDIEVNGNIPINKIFEEKLKVSPYFYSLTMATPEWITRVKLIKMGLKQVKITFTSKNNSELKKIEKEELKPEVNNQFYMIYKNNENIVSIWFK